MVQPPKDIKLIFAEALEKQTSGERAAYLDASCGNDAELLGKVEALLAAYEEADDVPDSPIIDLGLTMEDVTLAEQPGTIIGRYKLLEKIGEGGMAVVYMAEQKEPIRRKVALKIIKLGMDTKSVIARFEAERQALAMMDHPNIAKVFDAGTTDTGRPYFVMELVRGVSITEYCDKNMLNTRERLDLFIQICGAVQHAHQKGIIHRDIKPTNVMVTLHEGKPLPMVIDFGIAKATSQRLTEKTLFTRYAQMIGTPDYMSPEQSQMSRLDVDTRTDIYSLGVLLYELLTGTLPFNVEKLREAGYIEIQRIICEEEPDKPSTKLSTMGKALTDIAKHRKTNAESLPKLVRGDLDWIVMKSLEKDRARRYETATELAKDIERHLADELVSAGPPSIGYRLHKFVRRNRVGVMTGLLIAAALLVVAVVSAMYAVKAEDAKQEITGLLAGSYVDRAQALCEQGEVARGMLWLADSLKITPTGSNNLEQAIRTSLAAWYSQLHSLRSVVQYPDGITAVTFSPDGARILATCLDGTARFCDATTGQPIGKPLHHGSEVQAVAISPDGTRIATGGTDGTVRLWDAATLKPVGAPIQHEWGIKRGPLMTFSPDSTRLMTGGADGAVRLWDTSTGKSLGKAFRYEGKGGRSVRAVACCPEGLRVVLAIRWDIYQMFDADKGEPMGPPVDIGAGAMVGAISPDGTRFATAKYHSLIQVWDAAIGELAFEPIVKGGVIYALAFSSDGSRIASGGNTRVGRLWDAATGAPIGAPLRQRDTVRAVAFSPDGSSLVTGNDDGVVRMWNLIRSKYVGEPVKHEDQIIATAYVSDGLRILTETDDAVQVRDAHTGRPIGKPLSRPGNIRFLAFSPDGTHLMTKDSQSYLLLLWDIAKGELVSKSSDQVFSNISFSPDGSRFLVGGGREGFAWLLDAATLKCLEEFRPHRDIVSSVAFSPNGSQFLTGSYDGTVQLWDAATLEPIGKPMVDQSEVKAAVFSPDGTKVLIGFADGTIRLWDVTTFDPIGTPLQHVKLVNSVAYSPDSTLLLACSFDRMARFWDAATLKPIGPPLEHDCWGPKASFSADGSEILLADGHGTVAVWRAPPGPLQGEYERIACWAQVITGLELDQTGGVNVLDAATWQARQRRLHELGGPPGLTLLGPDPG